MSTLVKAFVSLSLLSSLVSAQTFNHDFDDEFNKMQSFINAMMNSDLKTKYFRTTYPKMDMKETKNSFIITFNVAGMDKKDIKLTLSDKNILTLAGEKKTKESQKEQNFMRQEIFYGEFQRSIQLPQNVDPATLKTKYENGILQVTVNKKVIDTTNVKVIPIN